MKNKFSTHWKSSKQPRKQRKYRANAPMHIRRKMMSVNLSKELRKKYGKRNFPVHKGDNVRIMRSEFKGKTGKIDVVDLNKMRVSIEGIYRSKKDGTKVGVYFNTSNLQIKELNLDDRKRREALERKNDGKNKLGERKAEQVNEEKQLSKAGQARDSSRISVSTTKKNKFKKLPKEKK